MKLSMSYLVNCGLVAAGPGEMLITVRSKSIFVDSHYGVRQRPHLGANWASSGEHT